jgi:hypothetical protein
MLKSQYQLTHAATAEELLESAAQLLREAEMKARVAVEMSSVAAGYINMDRIEDIVAEVNIAHREIAEEMFEFENRERREA